jgi:hypothetical protein
MSSDENLYCFMSAERACGPDCMSYAKPPLGKDYEEQQWAQCKILVSMHQAGKHLTVIASTLANEVADRKRDKQPQPPTVK